jgi:hypothetical protein
MTDMQKLTRYMYPYYQTNGDTAVLEDYLDEYSTPEKAACELWGELSQYILSGAVKSISTGAEATTFNSPKDIEDYCKARADFYSNKARKLDYNGSFLAYVEQETVAGGAL